MDFYKRMAIVCKCIPEGRVATYGQIALLCGKPKNARQVGHGLNRGLDGNHSIFLSTCGKNDNEVSETLVKFLKFVKADYSESTKDFEDAFVGRLQDAVRRIKESREMEERFMILED